MLQVYTRALLVQMGNSDGAGGLGLCYIYVPLNLFGFRQCHCHRAVLCKEIAVRQGRNRTGEGVLPYRDLKDLQSVVLN